MKKFLYSMLVFLLMVSGGCKKERPAPAQTFSCAVFAEGLLQKDSASVEAEIDNYLQYFIQKRLSPGANRHFMYLDKLVEQVNGCPALTVSHFCYDCIYTTPPQSELIINIDNDGQSVNRVLDLVYSGSKFKVVKIH